MTLDERNKIHAIIEDEINRYTRMMSVETGEI